MFKDLYSGLLRKTWQRNKFPVQAAAWRFSPQAPISVIRLLVVIHLLLVDLSLVSMDFTYPQHLTLAV